MSLLSIAAFPFRLVAPRTNVLAVLELVRLAIRYRSLTLEMAKRDLIDPYAGQVIGAVWAVLHPIAYIGIMLFVFAVVFRVRLEQSFDLPLDYASYILIGLVPWLAFQQSITKSCMTFLVSANLVKQVVFPLEVLPIKSVIASSIPLFVSLLALFAYILVSGQTLTWMALLLPVLIGLLFLLALGCAFFLSVACVVYRDIKDFVIVFTMLSVYLLPIVYLPGWVPSVFRFIVWINPFSYMVWAFQDVLYFGRFEHPTALPIFAAVSILTFVGGYRFFRRLKPQLAVFL